MARKRFRRTVLGCNYTMQATIRTLTEVHKGTLPFDRTIKVSLTERLTKEQIMALLTALKLFTSGAYDSELPEKRRLLQEVEKALTGLPVRCRLIVPPDGQSPPVLEIAVDEMKSGRSAFEVCRRLRKGQPAVQVGHGFLAEGKLIINPLNLNSERTPVLCRRLREDLTIP